MMRDAVIVAMCMMLGVTNLEVDNVWMMKFWMNGNNDFLFLNLLYKFCFFVKMIEDRDIFKGRESEEVCLI